MTPVYLDHNATTPIAEAVFETMLPFLRQHYGNGSSRHGFGTTALRAVNRAREQVAQAVGAQASQVIFTSGGTEANNLFIQGAAACLKPSQVVVSAIEHPCVAKPALALTRRGWAVHRIEADSEGRVALSDLDEALNKPTGIVSIMLANNETGVFQDVARAADMARSRGAVTHTDAVQALGKAPIDFGRLGVDAMTLSGHKIYGPKGVGALVVDKRLQLEPIMLGGGHERGLRSGTLNVPAIVGFGGACELAVAGLQETPKRLRVLRDHLEAGVRELGALVFGAAADRLSNTSYFAIPGIEGETLVVELDRAGYAVASGAACSSANPGPSATLLAMGFEPEVARSAVRVSLGEPNTTADVEGFLAALDRVVGRLRDLAAVTA